MRRVILASLLLAAPAVAQTPLNLEITGGSSSFLMTWDSRLGSNYQVEISANLVSWANSGVALQGSGSRLQLQGTTPSQRSFYRVKETDDPNNSGFTSRPLPDSIHYRIDGVGIAFDIPRLPSVPAKIRIFLRPVTAPAAAWQQIGQVTDFASKVRPPGTPNPANPAEYFVPGPVVWIPDAAGDYEIKTEAVSSTAAILGTATRLVHILENQAPVITFTSGPASGAAAVEAEFGVAVTDPDGDPIRKVEFYDNGVLMGTDTTPPFGNNLREFNGVTPLELLKGTHSITAKAYDDREGVGTTPTPWTVTVSGGNSRPQVLSASLTAGPWHVGDQVGIAYTAADPDGPAAIQIERVRIAEEDWDKLEDDTVGPFTGNTVFADTALKRAGSETWLIGAKDINGTWSYPRPVTVYLNPVTGPGFAQYLAGHLEGPGVTVSNPVYSGVELASDFFDGGLVRGLRMDEGIILTTGAASNWPLGDGSENRDAYWYSAGDPVLEVRILGHETNDAVVLECGVLSATTQTTIDLQFGSEEYDEYVGLPSQGGCFNDSFMVSLDGVMGSLTPDAEDLIAVHTIHPPLTNENRGPRCEPLEHPEPALREHLFLDDDVDIKPTVAEEFHEQRVEYDGMTIPLKLHFLASPGVSRQLRIAIADVNDAEWDSALFLKKASLKSTLVSP